MKEGFVAYYDVKDFFYLFVVFRHFYIKTDHLFFLTAFRSEIERKGIPQAKAPAKSVDQPQESANVDNPNSVAVTSDSTSGNGGFNIDDILHMDVIPGNRFLNIRLINRLIRYILLSG